MQKTCQQCGRKYEASRSSQKFCSNTCRQKAHHDKRAYPFTGEVCPPKINMRPLSQEEVDATIRNAHETATDLSRASAGTPSPLCLQLARVAVTLKFWSSDILTGNQTKFNILDPKLQFWSSDILTGNQTVGETLGEELSFGAVTF